ncbi:MAG: tRNA preQ1(34) S-adenosylmethionine ribosyltransferase-isomerase QueA [Patescibacteria group bacterium]
MAIKTADFDYILPKDRIAQTSVEPRDQSKLLVVDRTRLKKEDRHFFNLPMLLKPGDLIVWNDTKVFRARLQGLSGARDVELFLLRARGAQWQALLRPSKYLPVGSAVHVKDATFIVEQKSADGTAHVRSPFNEQETIAFANRVGSVPTPPYINRALTDNTTYQTMYAQHTGSVAAPTSGFHFTPALVSKLKNCGIHFASVTLHVGLGTFQPITAKTLDDHRMHSEWASVSRETVDAIARAKDRGSRVIAVGTTTVRALESAARFGSLEPYEGDVDLFIKPGFTFRIVDALITNFHLPKTTLLSLVSAFLGSRDALMETYQHALEHHYRFASFGDAMLIK